MSKTFKLVAWLALCLPMSSAFAQWSYKPVLEENAASGGSRWVLDVSMEVTANEGETVWLNAVEMSIQFSSSDSSGSGAELTSVELDTFVGDATLPAFASPGSALGFMRADTVDGSSVAVVWAQASGAPSLTCTMSSGETTCTIPLTTITVPAGPAVEADVVSATVSNLATGTTSNPGMVQADPLAYVSGGAVAVPEEPTVVAIDGPLTYTFPALPAFDMDLNKNGVVSGEDAVIMYFSSDLAGLSGTLSRSRGRANTLSAYAQPAIGTATDAQLVEMIAAANLLFDNNPTEVDINKNGVVSGEDAVIMYFSSDLAGLSGTLSRPRGRANTLSAYAQPAIGTATDAQLVEMIAAANLLLSSE